jgi:hypothetical protein
MGARVTTLQIRRRPRVGVRRTTLMRLLAHSTVCTFADTDFSMIALNYEHV